MSFSDCNREGLTCAFNLYFMKTSIGFELNFNVTLLKLQNIFKDANL